MKDSLIQFDRAVLRTLTNIVQRWIAARDFKQHKIDLLIKIEWFVFAALILVGILLPAAIHIIEHEYFTAGMHVFFWGIAAMLDWGSIQITIHRMKPFHDYLFSMRENPSFSNAQREMLQELFEKNRRTRLSSIGTFSALIVGMIMLLFFLNAIVPEPVTTPICAYWALALTVQVGKRYITYVFDFDEPKKKKKAIEAISEWLQRAWSELVGGFAPMPA